MGLPVVLGYFSSNHMFLLFLQLPAKKRPRPKWTIYKHVSDNSKECLSDGNFGILSVVCRRPSSSLSVARLKPTPADVEA